LTSLSIGFGGPRKADAQSQTGAADRAVVDEARKHAMLFQKQSCCQVMKLIHDILNGLLGNRQFLYLF
jgi:hypothetical protein